MVRRKDSELYKLILSLANEVVEGVQGGGVMDIPKSFDSYAPYDLADDPWLAAAQDVANHLGAKRLPISIYYGFSSIEVRVFNPEFK